MASSDDGGFFRSNRGVAIVLTVLLGALLAYLLTQEWVFDVQRDGFTLGFFPLMGAGLSLLCVLAIIVDRLNGATTPEFASARLDKVAKALFGLVVMLIYYLLAWGAYFSQDWLRPIVEGMPLSGEFVVWTPIFLAIGMFALGVRPWWAALATGVVCGLLVFGLFSLIGIELPTVMFQS